MAIKSILVSYSGAAASKSALDLALFMARKYDAHLTGVVWHGPSLLQSRYGGYLTRDVAAILTERDQAAVAEIRAEFETAVAEFDTPVRARFLDLAGLGDFSLAECARGYDITLICHRGDDGDREHFHARPDVVALRSGRPVIIVPPRYNVGALGDHALVAWDGKRAAARALGDAMQILGTKAQVTVLSVGKAPPPPVGDDIVALLGHHGVPTERLVTPVARGGVARAILDACRSSGAGILVMGAYEHSKFSEDILGGVTRDILDGADIPVLMSH